MNTQFIGTSGTNFVPEDDPGALVPPSDVVRQLMANDKLSLDAAIDRMVEMYAELRGRKAPKAPQRFVAELDALLGQRQGVIMAKAVWDLLGITEPVERRRAGTPMGLAMASLGWAAIKRRPSKSAAPTSAYRRGSGEVIEVRDGRIVEL